MLSSRTEIIAALRQAVGQQENIEPGERLSTGSKQLDSVLAGGLRHGSLVEWLGAEGSGGTTLAFAVARRTVEDGRAVVVIDQHQQFYPPAAAAAGICLTNTIIVTPRTKRDFEWALNQTLHCSAVAAVLCWPGPMDDRAFRRLQLSAEAGRTLGLLIREPLYVHEPSWAEVRFWVTPLGGELQRRFRLDVLRCSAGSTRSVDVEVDEQGLLHDAHPLPAISRMARATPVQRSSRA